MKKIIATALMLASVSSFAATIKVTSFNFIRTSGDGFYSPLAELCGKVEGATSNPTFVNVLVDPSTNKPASYNTLTDANGKFCVAVITFKGRAEASIIGDATATTEALIK